MLVGDRRAQECKLTQFECVAAVVAEDKPRSEEHGRDRDEDTKEMRKQRPCKMPREAEKGLGVKGEEASGAGRWGESLSHSGDGPLPQRCSEMCGCCHTGPAVRGGQGLGGEERSLRAETGREGKLSHCGRTTGMQTWRCGLSGHTQDRGRERLRLRSSGSRDSRGGGRAAAPGSPRGLWAKNSERCRSQPSRAH